MDLRSGRRIGSQPPPHHDGAPRHRRRPGGADRISNLSDAIILEVLTRLRCVRTAVRTGLLSRRWRDLWTRLTNLAFRGVAPATIEAAFSSFSGASPAGAGTVFQLNIHLPSRPQPADADSLLRAAAMFSPAGLVFTIPFAPDYGYYTNPIKIKLPCFQHATSIELDTQSVEVLPPLAAGEFLALEKLSVSGRNDHIAALVTRCPRLRELRAKLRCLERYTIGTVLASLKKALGSRQVVLSLLDICISEVDDSLLKRAAQLSPREFIFTNKYGVFLAPLDLPYFRCATSIKIDWQGARFTLPSCSGEFSVLERLCLFGCYIENLGKFVSRCPRLRVLRVDGATFKRSIIVHSASLQELTLGTYNECRGIHVVTPVLKQMTMEVHASWDIGASISAALVEKVSLRRSYTGLALVFGFWLLRSVSIETTKKDGDDDTWMQVQWLPRAQHVLSVDMCASDPSDVNLNFAQEMEKFPVTDFSTVDLRLETKGHVYGSTLLHLLQALPVHNAIKILKVTLLRSENSEVTRACIENCSCNEPVDWRSQSISLTYLEEVEIRGFKGENDGYDFLEVMLRCAPSLRKVTMKLGNKMKLHARRGCTKKIYNVSMAHPSVNFYVYLNSGTLVLHSRPPCS